MQDITINVIFVTLIPSHNMSVTSSWLVYAKERHLLLPYECSSVFSRLVTAALLLWLLKHRLGALFSES
jgi:hypothetical protein